MPQNQEIHWAFLRIPSGSMEGRHFGVSGRHMHSATENSWYTELCWTFSRRFHQCNSRADLAQFWVWWHSGVSGGHNPPLKMSGSVHSWYLGLYRTFSSRFHRVNSRADLAQFWGSGYVIWQAHPTTENVWQWSYMIFGTMPNIFN